MIGAPGLNEIRPAAERIRGFVRRTPLLAAAPAREHSELARGLLLNLESLQVTGSFKARGAINAVRALRPESLQRGIVTASGGNHGLALAYAGWAVGVPATIFLPRSVAADKIAKLDAWGARVVISGGDWDDSNRAALQHSQDENLTYVYPFANPAVIAGQGTIALEILEQDLDVDTLLVAIGGGALISGIAIAAKALKPGIRIVGAAVTLAPRSSDELILAIISEAVERVVLVEDKDMREAAGWLWRETGTAAELSGAASIAALLSGRYQRAAGERVCAVVCGTGTDGYE
jgi:threonine dehydratase